MSYWEILVTLKFPLCVAVGIMRIVLLGFSHPSVPVVGVSISALFPRRPRVPAPRLAAQATPRA